MKINRFYVVDTFHEILYDRIFTKREDAEKYISEIFGDSEACSRTTSLKIRDAEFEI